MSRSRPIRSVVWVTCLAAAASLLWGAYSIAAKETLEARRARVEDMNASKKAALERARAQFAALDPAERRRLHDLHQSIENHSRPDDLREVMTQYCDWIKTLSITDRDQLRSLEPAQRIEKMKQLRREQIEARQAGRHGRRRTPWGDRMRELTVREREGLIRWIDAYMGRGTPGSGLIDDLPEAEREKLRHEWKELGNDPDQRRKLFARVWVRWQLANPGEALPLDEDAVAGLRSELSERTNEWLGQIPPEGQKRFLDGLIGAFLFIHNLDELSEYLENGLSGEQRERLTSLPPEQMRQQLWWFYIAAKFPGMSPDGRPGAGRWPRGPYGQPPGGPPGQPRRGPRGPSRGPQPDRPPTDRIPDAQRGAPDSDEPARAGRESPDTEEPR